MSKQRLIYPLTPNVTSGQPPRAMWVYIGLGAILAAALACEISLAIVYRSGSSGITPLFFLFACLSGLLSGWLLWWLFIVRPRHATIGRGVFLGVACGLLSHPLMWAMLLPWSSDLLYFPIEVIESLIQVGWVAALIGGVTGGLLIYFQRTLIRRSMKPTFPEEYWPEEAVSIKSDVPPTPFARHRLLYAGLLGLLGEIGYVYLTLYILPSIIASGIVLYSGLLPLVDWIFCLVLGIASIFIVGLPELPRRQTLAFGAAVSFLTWIGMTISDALLEQRWLPIPGLFIIPVGFPTMLLNFSLSLFLVMLGGLVTSVIIKQRRESRRTI